MTMVPSNVSYLQWSGTFVHLFQQDLLKKFVTVVSQEDGRPLPTKLVTVQSS